MSDREALMSDEEARNFATHAESGGKIDLEGEGVEYTPIQPGDLLRMCRTIVALRSLKDTAELSAVCEREVGRQVKEALNKACGIIEVGDQRLLASDGPAGNQPPEISLSEWRTLYKTIDHARKIGIFALDAAPR